MKIALCQINTIAGNIAFNNRRIVEELRFSAASGAQLAIFPELSITGYPPKDLLEYPAFIQEAADSLAEIQKVCVGEKIDCIVGTVHTNVFGGKKELLNAAAYLSHSGEIQFTFKKLLPTYDVFDEHRHFQPCPAEAIPPIIEYPDARLGISICEDIWNDNEFWKSERLYEYDPIQTLVQTNAGIIVNISASPYVCGKPQRRVAMLRHTAHRWNTPVILVNQVGGCDQVVFDGGSCIVFPNGDVTALCGWFAEKTVIWDSGSQSPDPKLDELLARASDETASICDALTLGLRDYLRKTGFSQVIVGNSGGIDSAVVLALATQALGAQKVISVTMPGPFTSKETLGDSGKLADQLKIRHVQLPISGPFDSLTQVLRAPDSPLLTSIFGGSTDNISKLADENLQARIRGNILMWISNGIKSPRTLVLSTGNKSELAAGYCTLYGDMAGGLALISDVPKMMVYKLARFLNEQMGGPIPESILDREPTAELAPNQKDSDSLPPYPVLDEIIRLFIEERQSPNEIVASRVAPPETVHRVIRLIENAEYKRAQAAPGIKVTSKAFGFGRRIPIARG